MHQVNSAYALEEPYNIQELPKKANKLRPLLPKQTEIQGQSDLQLKPEIAPHQRAYKCFECPQNFASFRQLKNHEVTHDLEKINVCKFCCSLFANAEALEKHSSEMHEDLNYWCPTCSKQYKNRGHLLNHISKVHHRNGLIYYCCLCPQQALPTQYESKLALQQHFQAVHLLLSSNQDYEDENHKIEMNEEFLDEFLLNGATENSFQFSECWDALDLHLPDVLHLNNHIDENITAAAKAGAAYKCPKCCDHFLNQKMLTTHLAAIHSLSVLICNKCEASFQQWEELWKHKANHRISDTFQTNENLCKICDKSFKSSAALNYHIKTHSVAESKPHSCPYCGKEFLAFINLKQHLRIVHSLIKKHICLLCDKQFATLDHLKKHVLSQHQNERKHTCHVCAKNFTQLCHLKQHLAIHTSGKTLHCNICNSSFWRKVDLMRHIITKHDQAASSRGECAT